MAKSRQPKDTTVYVRQDLLSWFRIRARELQVQIIEENVPPNREAAATLTVRGAEESVARLQKDHQQKSYSLREQAE
jgi:hypothetical protein